jgi:taurine dioxygenase
VVTVAAQLQTLEPAFAARLSGLDLARPLDGEEVAAIRDAWRGHSVLVVPGQTLSPERQIAYSRYFGDLRGHTVSSLLHPDYPELLVLSNRGRGGTAPINNGGAYWHSDITYEWEPPMGSILHGVIVPPTGGDTLYADMVAAYEALDRETKQALEGVKAVHTYRFRYLKMVEEGVRPARTEAQMAEWIEVEHPVVRTVPDTGERALYVNEGFTARIAGWPEDESRDMLDKLLAHTVDERFVYRHRWQTGDVVMWDNRRTLHRATEYDLSQERTMHRTTISGVRPV